MKPEISKLLEQLKPIEYPNPIGFEMAYGWYLLIIALILILAIIWFFKNKKTSKQKLAFQELDNIEKQFKKDKNYKNLATQCNLLLRKYCQTQNITINDNFLQTLNGILSLPKKIKPLLEIDIYQKELNFKAGDLIDYCAEVIYKLGTIKMDTITMDATTVKTKNV